MSFFCSRQKKNVFNYFRIVTDLTFTRSSSADFIIQKLQRIFLVYCDLLDCLNIISNTCTFQVLEVLVRSSILIAICLFAKFRYDPFFQFGLDCLVLELMHLFNFVTFSGYSPIIIEQLTIFHKYFLWLEWIPFYSVLYQQFGSQQKLF